MKNLILIIVALLISSCGNTNSDSEIGIQPVPASSTSQHALPDSITQYLLKSTATDFILHPPVGQGGFKEVRIGYLPLPDGTKQYRLCGQYIVSEQNSKVAPIPFVTIKTSGYELYLGSNSAMYCQDSTIVWDSKSDYTDELQKMWTEMK